MTCIDSQGNIVPRILPKDVYCILMLWTGKVTCLELNIRTVAFLHGLHILQLSKQSVLSGQETISQALVEAH